jgi:hypothetical protein
LLVLVAALALTACGSSGSSGDAKRLIRETFGNGAKVHSGNINLLLNVTTVGLRGINGPIQLRFGGPFDKPAKGSAPRFAFTLTGGLAGRTFSAGATSTGSRGFLSLQGSNYELPEAEFAAFRKSISSVQGIAQPKTNTAGDITWLTDAKVQGEQDVSGEKTTHVTATIDVGKLLDQLEGKRPAGQRLTGSQRQGVLNAVKDGRFDFYTGTEDKILRRVLLTFRLVVPKASQQKVGGLRSARVTIDYAIADLNQPQTITVPGNLRPTAELNRKLRSLAQQLGAIGSLLNSGGTGSSQGSGTAGSTQIQKYQACLTEHAGNSTEAKKCLKLLQTP